LSLDRDTLLQSLLARVVVLQGVFSPFVVLDLFYGLGLRVLFLDPDEKIVPNVQLIPRPTSRHQ